MLSKRKIYLKKKNKQKDYTKVNNNLLFMNIPDQITDPDTT